MDSVDPDDLPGRTAFVFGGGASLGAVQLGMLRAVLERGFQPDLVLGTSVGAINGAFMAESFDHDRLQELIRIWSNLQTGDVFPSRGWGAAYDTLVGRGPPSLASHDGLRDLLRGWIPSAHGELDVPCHVVATDLLTGERVVFDEGPLEPHLLASSAIPGVYPPVQSGDRTLVDGGVAANVPVLPARTAGATSIIVLDPGYPCALTEPPAGAIGYAMHVVTLMLRHQSHGALHFLGDEAVVLYPTPPCPLSVPPHRFDRTGELVDRGYEAALEFFDGLAGDGPGVYGHPHFHPPEPAV
ncbi:MAG: patatin-like phospholipase family protein [Bradymonadaceae bacterium]